MSLPVTAIFPGTFDPITIGHLELIERAARLFPTLIVAIASSPHKKTLFSLEERVAQVKSALRHESHVQVMGYDLLMAKFAQQHHATVLVRGVRSTVDFEYEKQLAYMNRHLERTLETVFLLPSPEVSFISSSLVKEVAAHGGSLQNLVTPDIEREVHHRLKSL